MGKSTAGMTETNLLHDEVRGTMVVVVAVVVVGKSPGTEGRREKERERVRERSKLFRPIMQGHSIGPGDGGWPSREGPGVVPGPSGAGISPGCPSPTDSEVKRNAVSCCSSGGAWPFA